MIFGLSGHRMRVSRWDAMCVSVIGITLTLGLWPFHSPANEIAWLPGTAGLRLGRPATLSGFNDFKQRTLPGDGASVEVWLQPGSMWDSGTFLSLYRPEGPRVFSLRQAQTDLEVRLDNPGQDRTEMVEFQVPNVFRETVPVFLAITSGSEGTLVYKNGRLVGRAQDFRLPTSAL